MKHLIATLLLASLTPSASFAYTEAECAALEEDVVTVIGTRVHAIKKGMKHLTRSQLRTLMKSNIVKADTMESDFAYDTILADIFMVEMDLARMDDSDFYRNVNYIVAQYADRCSAGDI